MKRCTRCQVEKPLEAFARKCTSPDGHRTRCRACESETRRARPPAAEGHKICRRCVVEKPLADFSVHSCKSDGRRSWCRDCVAQSRDTDGARVTRALRRVSDRQARRLAAGLAVLRGVKPCITCHVEQPLADFWRRASSPDGRADECRKCTEARRQQPDPEDRARWERWQAAKLGFSGPTEDNFDV